MEAVYGRETSEMLATLSYQGLVDEVDAISDLNPDDTHLKLHLAGRNPDDGMTAIAYDKGYFFLRLMEETVGRERFDGWLKGYFEAYAFKGMDTERFVDYLDRTLLEPTPEDKDRSRAWRTGSTAPASRTTALQGRQPAHRAASTPPSPLGKSGNVWPPTELPWERLDLSGAVPLPVQPRRRHPRRAHGRTRRGLGHRLRPGTTRSSLLGWSRPCAAVTAPPIPADGTVPGGGRTPQIPDAPCTGP